MGEASITITRKTVPPFFQLLLILVSLPLVGWAFYNALSSDKTFDPKPHILQVTPEKVAAFGGFQSTVKVGLFIDQFQEFNIVTDNFVFTGIVWFQFNPGVISIDTLSKFGFERGRILDLSEPYVRLVDDKLMVRYNVRVQFNTELDYRTFPVDSHLISIIMIHNFLSPTEILFESSERNFIVDAQVQGWNLIDKKVETGYTKSVIDAYDKRLTVYQPEIIFKLVYSIAGVRNILSILLPLLLIFYLISFSFSVDVGQAISLTAGGVTGILAYRFVIENLSPKAGYFMISDYFFFLFLTVSFLFFFLNVIDLLSFNISLWVKKAILIAIYGFVNMVVFYLLWF